MRAQGRKRGKALEPEQWARGPRGGEGGLSGREKMKGGPGGGAMAGTHRVQSSASMCYAEVGPGAPAMRAAGKGVAWGCIEDQGKKQGMQWARFGFFTLSFFLLVNS